MMRLTFYFRSNASSGWMSKSNNLSQYKYGSSGGSKTSSMSRSGGAARGGGAMRMGGGSGPGMMPVPQPRSFLTGGGHYF